MGRTKVSFEQKEILYFSMISFQLFRIKLVKDVTIRNTSDHTHPYINHKEIVVFIKHRMYDHVLIVNYQIKK